MDSNTELDKATIFVEHLRDLVEHMQDHIEGPAFDSRDGNDLLPFLHRVTQTYMQTFKEAVRILPEESHPIVFVRYEYIVIEARKNNQEGCHGVIYLLDRTATLLQYVLERFQDIVRENREGKVPWLAPRINLKTISEDIKHVLDIEMEDYERLGLKVELLIEDIEDLKRKVDVFTTVSATPDTSGAELKMSKRDNGRIASFESRVWGEADEDGDNFTRKMDTATMGWSATEQNKYIAESESSTNGTGRRASIGGEVEEEADEEIYMRSRGRRRSDQQLQEPYPGLSQIPEIANAFHEYFQIFEGPNKNAGDNADRRNSRFKLGEAETAREQKLWLALREKLGAFLNNFRELQPPYLNAQILAVIRDVFQEGEEDHRSRTSRSHYNKMMRIHSLLLEAFKAKVDGMQASIIRFDDMRCYLRKARREPGYGQEGAP